MATNYKRKGFTNTQSQNVTDATCAIIYSRLDRRDLVCPVCGKRTLGLRPEGYMHPARKRGQETTYCKREVKSA